ncbi:nocobactin polyketide synthase NbtC [Nocardia uniformis]|uniref:Nocobactin polyketide synthase NbtC n=1 Tax=Nocardia uniformis TaxID=53432 RepID=A0A849CEU3_9NOCA|nr:nocobactin polyketide synthase NbtC [Nocardia uniformis]NNH71821.1 nocobactin polyketide synthase NbtC [Nocardia uniformis]
MSSYLLPDGSIPVLLSSDTADGLRAEAANILDYLRVRPRITPNRVADMLFRTRMPRRYRALAMVTTRDELLDALRAIAAGSAHPAVVASDGPATARRIGFVFPGQGSQRPGMGKLFYELSTAYRARVDECAAVHLERFGHDQPLHYLLGTDGRFEDEVWEVQPALMFHMTGLAAMWRAAGVDPAAVIGHSQGELAAGAVSGVMSLRDAVLVVTHRARLVERLSPRGYSMAVLAMDREAVEALLARHSGWAELSVINSPNIIAISGDRDTIRDMVAAATERGQFAREIGVAYPAHTSIVAEVRADFEGFLDDEMDCPTFSDSEIACYGATLGEAITAGLAQEQYWYWNLRNRVRFDQAVVAAATDGVDTLIEVVEHPVLQLAIQENLTLVPRDRARGNRDFRVLGTSVRTADSLREFTRNLATVAVHDLGYRWEALRVESGTAPALPLRDFPHTVLHPRKLWAAAGYEPSTITAPASTGPTPQRLVERWLPMARRALVAPRTIALVDHTGECAELVSALSTAADRHGATIVDADGDYDTAVLLLPSRPEADGAATVSELTEFFAQRAWQSALSGLRPGGECWLVTTGGEAVIAGDPVPQLFHGGVSAGFRCVGVENPGILFRHLDLSADAAATQAARIVGALHTAGEAELALRDGKVFVKRLVADESEPGAAADLDHILIIGGTGQLGLRFCEHFAHAGAGRITLLSRSGETAGVASELARLRNIGGVEIAAVACDVTDPAAVANFAAAQSERPVSLLIHAAVNYVDAELADITAEMVATATASKVVGLETVLAAVPRTTDCRMVLCSSMAATLGGRGQILYAVTNRMLDIISRRLRAQGIDSVSLEWGLWSVAGPLDDAGFARVEGAGVFPMQAADAIAAGFTGQPSDAVIIAADWEFVREVLSAFGQDSVLSEIPEHIEPVAAIESTPVDIAPVVVAAAPAETVTVDHTVAAATDLALVDRMAVELGRVMGIDGSDDIDRSVPLVALGLDSLQALDFRKRVRSALDRDLPVAAILGGASLDDVVALMAENTN